MGRIVRKLLPKLVVYRQETHVGDRAAMLLLSWRHNFFSRPVRCSRCQRKCDALKKKWDRTSRVREEAVFRHLSDWFDRRISSMVKRSRDDSGVVELGAQSSYKRYRTPPLSFCPFQHALGCINMES